MMIQRGESERLCVLVGLAVGGQRIVRSCMIITLTKDSKKKALCMEMQVLCVAYLRDTWLYARHAMFIILLHK